MGRVDESGGDGGFTLIELLIAIVVAGILAAVAIVGIAGVTNTGAKSACAATTEAARASSVAFYANSATHQYPTKWADMTGSTPPTLQLASGVTIDGTDATGKTLVGGGWHAKIAVGGATATTFSCSVP